MTSDTIELIGLPYHLGTRADNQVNKMAEAPERLLASTSLPKLFDARGYKTEVTMIDHDEPTDEDTGGDFRLLPAGDQMGRILVQISALARAVDTAISAGRFPFCVGSTCTAGMGVAGGVAKHSDADSLGMIWFDGHADAQTPDTSHNGFIEGMPVSTIAGMCWPLWRSRIPGFRVIPESRISTIGVHEVHAGMGRPAEWHSGALGEVVDPPRIAELGFGPAVERAVQTLASNGVSEVFVHFDVDCIGTEEFQPNRHGAPGGLTTAQATEAFEIVGNAFDVLAFNVAAWDPAADERSQPFVERLCEAALTLV